jgi:hypothetical protein
VLERIEDRLLLFRLIMASLRRLEWYILWSSAYLGEEINRPWHKGDMPNILEAEGIGVSGCWLDIGKPKEISKLPFLQA